MSRGRPRKPISEDRLIRKRLAARLRQRRCRERKKGSGQGETKPDNVSGATKVDLALQTIAKETNAAPPSPPYKMQIVHVPVPTYFGLPPYHRHPMYMPHPMGIPPSHHHHRHPRAHPGYVAHSHYHHRLYPMMTHPHHATGHKMPYTAASTTAQSDTIPRTVSRSSSDASSDDSILSSEVLLNVLNKKKRKKSLASEEKTAVAAILSLKSNSSDEDSSDETISTSDGMLSLVPEFIADHSTIIQRVDNAQSVFRAVSV